MAAAAKGMRFTRIRYAGARHSSRENGNPDARTPDPGLIAASVRCIVTPHMGTTLLKRELKRGSIELLIPALLDERQRHGYDISRLIEERTDGAITFHTASLYPTLYRLEDRGLIEGRWIERAGQRRRRYYRLTASGRKVLAAQRSVWDTFFIALDRV